MKKINPLFYIFLTIFIDMVGFGIAIPILPSYVTRFGTGATTVGFLIAIYSLMQFVSAPILGRLSDTYGRKHLLAFSLLGTAIGYLITGLGGSLFMIFVGRIIDGITGGNISVAQAYIADVTTPAERSRAIGLTGAAFGAGFIVGPAIGGLFSHISPGAPFFFAALVAFLNTIAVMLFLPEPKEHAIQTTKRNLHMFSIASLKEAFNPPQIGAFVLLFFLINLGFSMIHGTVPLLSTERLSWNTAHNGYFFAFIGVMSVITQGFLIGRLVKRFGDLRVAIAGFLLVGMGLTFLGVGFTATTFFLAGFCIAVGSGLAQSTLQGLISKYSDASEQGAVMGIAQGFAALARTFGPLYGGFTYDFFFHAFPYFSGAVILVGMGIGSLFQFRWLNKPKTPEVA